MRLLSFVLSATAFGICTAGLAVQISTGHGMLALLEGAFAGINLGFLVYWHAKTSAAE